MQIELRLVIENELTLADSTTQLAFQCQSSFGFFLKSRFEKLEVAFTDRLGLIHCHICFLEQLVGVNRVIRIKAHADTR